MELAAQLLLRKLDHFIKRYYLNQLVRGSIYFLGIFVFAFLIAALLEHFGRYTTQTRTGLFYTLLALGTFLLARFIIYPLTKLFKFGKTINYEQAAVIIGKHFSHVSDKLLNTLQLLSENAETNSLLAAAIDQKTAALQPLPFTAAIDVKKNYKYLKFAAIPLIALIATVIIAPSVLSDSTKRIVNYDLAYKVPAPFSFTIENKSLKAEQYQDFELKISVAGSELPNEVNIHFLDQKYKLDKIDATHFSYTFKNIQQSTTFFLEALGFEDESKQINVVKKPVLLNYIVKLKYPRYLGLKDQVLNNPADLNIPAGTIVNWQFTGKQTSMVSLIFTKLKAIASSKDQINYSYSRKFFISDDYSIVLSNEDSNQGDSLHFVISVQPDAYPSVIAEQRTDSVSGKYIYLAGLATDDYGLSKLSFHYRFTKSNDKSKVSQGVQSKVLPSPTDKRFSINHIFDLYEIGFNLSDEIEYYFEVWDNDGVNGAKSSKSEVFSIKAPDKQKLREETDASSNALQEKMEEALKEAKDLQKELDQLQQKLKTQQPLTWEEKKRLEQVSEQQKELQQKMQELQKDFKQKNLKEQSFKEEQERIVEKQQELQKMYEQLMSEEMKQLMKQIENMMKLQNKDQIRKELDKMELSNKDVEKELDRMLEMYKELEVDKRQENAMKDLKELAEKQRELANKESESTKQDKQQKQEEINKEFDQLQKDLKELEKKNNELENPKELADTKELEKEISEKLEQSSNELSKGNDKKSKQNQNEAADKMEEMQQKMQDQKEKDEEEQDEIDAQALREILENLVQLSKDQEKVMEELKLINGYNPKFVELAKEQKIIKDNAKMIEDSLLSLSKRAPEVKSFINKEVTKMNDHLDRSNLNFSQRNIGETRVQQQYAMTRMNNLAVMLSESLKQMQQEMQMKKQSKSGKGKGKPKPKPGSGKPSMKQLKKMQEEMNKQMKEGMNKNGKGEKGKGQMTSEQYARMAAQQMAIRQQMQKMMSEMDALEKEKMGGGKQLGELQKKMEETEKDLVNKRLTQETLMRQEEILTRLLEHEKAEKQQEQEQKREAEQGKEKPRPSPVYLDMLNQKQKRETELLQTVPAEMQPYYKQKAKEYLEKAE